MCFEFTIYRVTQHSIFFLLRWCFCNNVSSRHYIALQRKPIKLLNYMWISNIWEW